eukprot:TRINITY_DN8758_c0_g1_i1.p1 TRINITY_DN8758_c0_g1~~TRINITY_DN8758_c0_g1_i1.p1  ORF type:complete len:387 (+),score=104.48 TRINITY_DN8758_c0_g1_i1:87-1247(+)
MADACKIQLDEPAEEAIAGRIQAAADQEHALHLECSICKYPALRCPVKTVPCGHHFHKDCLGRWLNGKVGKAHHCPQCRMELASGDGAFTNVDLPVKAILDATRVDCPQDCGQPKAKRMRYDELAAHIREKCPRTPLVCSSADCGEVLPRQDMVGAHLPDCEHVLVTCGQCKTKVKRGVLLDHKTQSCTHRRFTCAFCKKKSIVYHKKEEHELECTGPVQMQVVAGLRQQNRKLQEQNREMMEQMLKEQEKRECRDRAVCRLLNSGEDIGPHQLMLAMLGHKGGVPQTIKVDSVEKPNQSGEYTLAWFTRNGHRVWVSAEGGYVYKGNNDCWFVASSLASMHAERGTLTSANPSVKTLPVALQWDYCCPTRWHPAPGTRVEVARCA